MFSVFYVEQEICSCANHEERPIHSINVIVVIVLVELNCLRIVLELLKSVDESTNAVIIALITREFQVTFSSCVEYELIFSSKECSCDSFTQKLRRSTYWLANLVFRASTWNVGP